MFFAYFGPETTLPLASVLAASLGFLMMMGRGSLRIASRIVDAVRTRFAAKSGRPAAMPHPHLSSMKRGDRPHRGGEIPAWARPDRQAAGSTMADASRREDEPSNG